MPACRAGALCLPETYGEVVDELAYRTEHPCSTSTPCWASTSPGPSPKKQWNPTTRKYVQADPITRTGLAWSAGPADDTVWVLPDQRRSGEGQAVCVHATRKAHTVRPIDRRPSTEMQPAALGALPHRLPLHVEMQRGSDGTGAYGHNMKRGA